MMRLGRLPFIAVMIASLAAWAGSRAQAPGPAQSSRFLLGVVRGDGVLLPLASRGDQGWTTLRRFDPAGRGLFRIVDAQRMPREGWIYVPWNTGVPRPLDVLDLVTTDAHCGSQEGFVTNAPSPDPILESPHLAAGIAIHGDASTVPIEDAVDQPDAASQRVAQFIVQLTHALEAEQYAARSNSRRTTVPAEGRERVPVQITTLARAQVFDAGQYYFEAYKRYGAIEAYANGWLASSPSSVSIVSTQGGIDAGGETARSRGRVLGVLRRGAGRMWVMEMRHYESDSYDIVEMPRPGRVLSISGGGC